MRQSHIVIFLAYLLLGAACAVKENRDSEFKQTGSGVGMLDVNYSGKKFNLFKVSEQTICQFNLFLHEESFYLGSASHCVPLKAIDSISLKSVDSGPDANPRIWEIDFPIDEVLEFEDVDLVFLKIRYSRSEDSNTTAFAKFMQEAITSAEYLTVGEAEFEEDIFGEGVMELKDRNQFRFAYLSQTLGDIFPTGMTTNAADSRNPIVPSEAIKEEYLYQSNFFSIPGYSGGAVLKCESFDPENGSGGPRSGADTGVVDNFVACKVVCIQSNINGQQNLCVSVKQFAEEIP